MLLPMLLGCAESPDHLPVRPVGPDAWDGTRVLKEGVGPFGRVVADATHAYLPVGGTIQARDRGTDEILKISLADGTASVLVTGARHVPSDALTLDGDQLYWTSTGGIARVSTAGGPTEIVVPSSETVRIRPAEIVVHGDRLLWIEWTSERFPSAPVRAAPKGGGPVSVVAPPQHEATGLTIAGDEIVFATPQGLREVVREGDPPAPVPNGPPGSAVRVVQDAEAFYTIQLHEKRTALVRVPKDGSKAETLAPDALWTADIAIDEQHVYYVDRGPEGESRIRRVPKGGGEAETLATGARTSAIHHLAIAAGQLLFVDRDGLRSIPLDRP